MPEQTEPAENQPGCLFVVATPIGNLGDMSARAVETLRTVDVIACEDTRHTKNLCRHFGITTPLVSYYREKEQSKSDQLLEQLFAGRQIALVSDAGTPGVSDPGAVLVHKARAAGVEIVAVPGPSALATAISVAGLEETAFFFGGFPPAAKNERRQWLRGLTGLTCTLIFYEAPHRIADTLRDMAESLGDRPALLFRELTKIHEDCMRGNLAELAEQASGGVKGELVLIVSGAAPATPKPEDLDGLLRWYRDERQTSLKDAVQAIARDLDQPRSQVYKQALIIWKEKNESHSL